jgi:hypothetical protein
MTNEEWPKGNSRPFGTLPNGDGTHLVIANDSGREVAVRDTLKSASGVAWKLNQAAESGPKALVAVLGGLR